MQFGRFFTSNVNMMAIGHLAIWPASAKCRIPIMLLSFAFSNFHSFAERTEVRLTLNQRDTTFGWDRTSPSGQRASTALAVMGANGAGKTTLIKALVFLADFVRNSFAADPKAEIPFMPHLANADAPAEFELQADDPDGSPWRYVLRATPQRVLHEALYRKGERMSYVFERDWREIEGHYDIRQQGFGLAESEAKKVRPNVSLLAWAAQYGVTRATQVSAFLVASNLVFAGGERMQDSKIMAAAEFFAGQAVLHESMKSLLTSWDLGLADVQMRRFDLPPTQQGQGPKPMWVPFGVHRTRSRSFELPFGLESSGTQTALVLLWRLLPALAMGGVAVIDELENDLHPHLLEPVLRLFDHRETNPQGAQIIFTCQSPEVLKLLQRAQVMFVDKTDCESSA